MRNAEYKGRVESRNETRAAIPFSAFGWGGEGSLGGRWHRGASHARTRPGPGPARRGEGDRARARRLGARDRGAGAAALSVSSSPPAHGADLPAHLVEQPAGA